MDYAIKWTGFKFDGLRFQVVVRFKDDKYKTTYLDLYPVYITSPTLEGALAEASKVLREFLDRERLLPTDLESATLVLKGADVAKMQFAIFE